MPLSLFGPFSTPSGVGLTATLADLERLLRTAKSRQDVPEIARLTGLVLNLFRQNPWLKQERFWTSAFERLGINVAAA